MTEPWFQRRFPSDLPLERLPVILERLRGTPARVEEQTRGLDAAVLVRRDGGTWSIQENVGHLLDLEALWHGRLEDFSSGAPVLRATDVANAATWRADHNATPLAALLAGFRRERARLVAAVERFEAPQLARTALHPRLQQPMRVVDLALFVAEHDDHHLARIQELRRAQRAPIVADP